MKKRNRVKDAIRHKETDIIPYNVELTKDLEEKTGHTLKLDAKGFFNWSGNHIEKCGFEEGEYIEPGIYQDEYGVIWDRSGMDKDIGIIKGTKLPNPTLAAYAFPETNKSHIAEKCKRFLENERDTFKFAKIGTTLFERAWSLRGFETLFMDFLLERSFAEELLERITDRNLEILEIALEYDFEGVYFGDDYGQQTGLMMSPDMWRKFIKPQLKRMFDKAKSKGKTVCLHSCGNIEAIFSDLIDIGLDIYQTVQPEIYNLEKIKSEYGDHLTFFGAISTQRDLPSKKPEEIKAIVKKTIAVLGKNGGYIAAPTHRVTGDVPVENISALIEALKFQ